MSAALQRGVRCSAIRKDGQPYRSPFVTGCVSGINRMRAKRSAKAVKRHQATSARRERSRTRCASLQAHCSPRLRKWRKRSTPRAGRAIASIASALVRADQAGEYEERLRQLEQLAHEQGLWRDRKGKDRGPIQWPTED